MIATCRTCRTMFDTTTEDAHHPDGTECPPCYHAGRAVATSPTADPKAAALALVRRLMARHGLTAEDLRADPELVGPHLGALGLTVEDLAAEAARVADPNHTPTVEEAARHPAEFVDGMIEMRQFRVWLRSVPGHYAQYDGKVDVWADDADQAVDLALDKLQRTSFPDRGRGCWRVEKVEALA